MRKRDGPQKKNKPTKKPIDWPQTLIGALVDLFVGVILLLIAKIME